MVTQYYNEADFISLSALQHYTFCPRRCALVHIEQQWSDNTFTAEGNILHERVDSAQGETRGNLIIARSVRLHSFKLGLAGISDVVEFHHAKPDTPAEQVISLPNKPNYWQPFPVEYKRGETKDKLEYKIQLCAQAICLEEMLNVTITKGALFYGISKRRSEILFDIELRNKTLKSAFDIHSLINKGETPKAIYQKKCDKCSLFDICNPKITGINKKVRQFIQKSIKEEP